MKKAFVFMISALIFAAVASARALAYENPLAESIASAAGAEEITGEYITPEEARGERRINVYEKVISIVSDTLSQRGGGLLARYGALLGLVVLCCAVNAFKPASGALDNALSFASVTAVSLSAFMAIEDLVAVVTAYLTTLTAAVSSLLPATAALYIMGGNPSAGAASANALALFLSAVNAICSGVLLPVMRVSFALCLAGACPGGVNLSSAVNLVKNTLTSITAFVFTLLGFTLWIQTTVAAATDNYLSRSVRFASGVLIPVIGNSLGEASRSFAAAVGVVRGSVGLCGTVIMLSAVIPPMLFAVLNKLLMLAVSIISRALGCERESRLLYDVGSLTGVLMALTIGAGVVSVLGMAMFLKIGVTA